jgi:methylglutaconyl-CoA hydratase
MTTFIRTSATDRVTTITLARPELHNAFNEVVIAELTQAFEAVGGDDAVRTVVLAGEGKSFCAGADIAWMKRMVDYSFDENVADARAMSDMLRTIRECPKPVIARIHGACIGGGVGLAAACDMAVAVRGAVFCLSEVKLGIVPAVISPFVMEKIGPGAMRRYALTAERFDADEARRIGLISEVVESAADLDAWIAKIAELIAGNGPQALAACKQVLRDVQATADWDEKQTITSRCIAERRASAEGQEGLKAFLEKRKAAWAGE